MKKIKFLISVITSLALLTFCSCSADKSESETSGASSKDNDSKDSSSHTDSSEDTSREPVSSDSGSTPVTSSQLESTASHSFVKSGASNPFVVVSDYEHDHIIVAEVDATWDAFGADKTGKTDASAAIQAALDYCHSLGGGTVWLPAGRYLLEHRIQIYSGVSLTGDYVEPEDSKNGDYGTLLLIKPSSNYASGISAVRMSASSSIEGLTFYYPDQKAPSPKDYYYTIECTGSSCTIRNVNLMNSYCGITNPQSSAIGMATFDNVRGTALKNGFYSFSEGDICYYTGLDFSPEYWASMPSSFSPPKEASIRSAMTSINSVGIRVQNIDRSCYKDIKLDGFYYGIYDEKPNRSAWCGSWYNLKISNSVIGIYALGISNAYGVNIANSSISGSQNSIINLSPNGNFCHVNLLNCTLKGACTGPVIKLTGSYSYIGKSTAVPLPASNKIFNAADYGADRKAVKDSTASIQNALDAAHKNGGGIVYLPSGKYLVKGNLTVYAGTLFTGSSQYSTLNPSDSAVIIAIASSKELITVSGKGSGVAGMYITYPENGIFNNNYMVRPSINPYAIKCCASNTYVKCVTIVAASHAVSFENADNFIVNRLYMTAWYRGVNVSNSDNGIIFGIHVNVTYTFPLISLDSRFSGWLNASKTIEGQTLPAAYVMIDYNVRSTLLLLSLSNSHNVALLEDFHYGACNFALLNNSSVNALNCEASRLNSSGYFFKLTGSSSVTGANMICYGTSSSVLFQVGSSSSLKLYNVDTSTSSNYNY